MSMSSAQVEHQSRWPRVVLLSCVFCAIVLQLAVFLVTSAWQHLWRGTSESAMQFVFVFGPLSIAMFIFSAALSCFRKCRSRLSSLLLILWLLIAVTYIIVDGS